MYERHSHPRRNLLKLTTHFVWATKDRVPIILPEYERRLYHYIETVFLRYESHVLAIGGMPNHIHILVALSPKFAISDVVRSVKGSSSHFASTTLRSGDWFQWQPNYAAISVSPNHVAPVSQYILNQKQHHADGSIKAHWEESDAPMEPTNSG